MTMRVLDLFAGDRSIAKAFEGRGHEVYTIDWDRKHPNIDWYANMFDVNAEEIIKRFGRPDVIWASPPDEKLLEHTVSLIKELSPTYYFIENPRGKMLKVDVLQDIPRYTVTYCQYGDTYMKPTDIWTNHPEPNFKPQCNDGDPCHISAPRGSMMGAQGIRGAKDSSRIPEKLTRYIVDITTTYKLIDINEEQEQIIEEAETLNDLKYFINNIFDDEEDDRLFTLLFSEVESRLEGIGYAAEEN